ncbi:MAG: beta-galactosidase [Oscillospiraceae bacterium]|nr:beta-galactosidase [Oscillospiraceae bacterium]
MRLNLQDGWQILQDVHDNGENCDLRHSRGQNTNIGMALSDWEPLPELKHLQLLLDEHPYYGRQLRYFNQAPWWYRKLVSLPDTSWDRVFLHFTNVDYYCKVWFNGHLVAEHEGYMLPFEIDVTPYVLPKEENLITVKVWSPWDDTVDRNTYELRTFRVERRMVKGTYEHADTFVQRDVNPIGIYGEVYLDLLRDVHLMGPKITYDLSLDTCTAKVKAETALDIWKEKPYRAVLTVTDPETGTEVLREETPVSGKDLVLSGTTTEVKLWSLWDQGEPNLYHVKLDLLCEGALCDTYGYDMGFRTISLERDTEKTQAILNGRPVYIRGTSYFPDAYISNMTSSRYIRDLQRIKEAGFNFIRIHVHVELPLFYELCTKLGLGIMQDSEFNWMHPTDESYEKRFVEIYTDTIRMLMHHTSIFFWVCLNEPGFNHPDGMHCRLMDVSPGPALYAAARKTDPSRSVIKGSCWEEDLLSGDSHNYIGSLVGHDTHYSDIYGTTEKFNTEFGFDAPPVASSLETDPRLYARLKDIVPYIDEIQEYQYKLLKYYTEH